MKWAAFPTSSPRSACHSPARRKLRRIPSADPLGQVGLPAPRRPRPVAALSISDRPFDDLSQAVRRHNALWLAPDADDYPNLTYNFVGEKRHPVALTKTSSSYLRRGVTLWLGWDSFLANPQQYKAPIQFDAKLDGKPVIVAAVSGLPSVCAGVPGSTA